MRYLALLISFVALALAAPARGSSAEVRGELLQYEAASGEANALRVAEVDARTVRLTDAGATVTPGTGCRSLDAHTVECSYDDPRFRVEVLLGDGRDTVTSERPTLIANGGSGDDTLTGAAASDTLDGGGGRDRLVGGGGYDSLTDGDTPGAIGSDILDGGADADRVSYATRTAALTVDLEDPSRDGERGEGDILRGFENADAGSGDDRIYGSSDYNALRGGAGDDVLVGRGHADELFGEAGDDRLLGGRGYDSLHTGPGRDRVDGASGFDDVHGASPRDKLDCGSSPGDQIWTPAPRSLIPRNCEQLRYEYDRDSDTTTRLQLPSHPTAVRPASVRFTLGCAYPPDLDGQCATTGGTLRLRDARGAALGRGTIARSDARERNVRVKLTSAGRRAIALRGGVVAEVVMSGQGLPDASWRIRLRR